MRAKERGRWHAVGWLTKGTLAAAFCVCFPGRTTSLAQETSWQDHLGDGQKLREQGRYTEAEKVYSAVLVEAETFGPEDRRVAITLNKLAGLYHARGRLSEAEPLYRRALAIWEKLPERMELASTLNNLARLCLDQEKYDEVVALSKRALGISESDAPNGPEVANSLNNLADVHAIQGRHAEAEPLYRQALTILENSFGPGTS